MCAHILCLGGQEHLFNASSLVELHNNSSSELLSKTRLFICSLPHVLTHTHMHIIDNTQSQVYTISYALTAFYQLC